MTVILDEHSTGAGRCARGTSPTCVPRSPPLAVVARSQELPIHDSTYGLRPIDTYQTWASSAEDAPLLPCTARSAGRILIWEAFDSASSEHRQEGQHSCGNVMHLQASSKRSSLTTTPKTRTAIRYRRPVRATDLEFPAQASPMSRSPFLERVTHPKGSGISLGTRNRWNA